MAKQGYLQEYASKKLKSNTGSTLSSKLENAKTRIKDAGYEKDSRNPLEKFLGLPEDQNALFDIFELIGRPQQAIFGGIKAAQTGEDVIEGGLAGLKGEDFTYAGELLRNAGMDANKETEAELFDPSTWGASDVLGFAGDLFADPLSIPLAPVKGAKVAKTGFDLIGDATRLGIKKTAGLADNAVSAGLKAFDKTKGIGYVNDIKQVNKANQAIKGSFEGYKKIKDELKQVFNYSKAVPDNLVRKTSKVENQVDLATDIMTTRLSKYVDDIEGFAKATGRNSDDVAESILKVTDVNRVPTTTIDKAIKTKKYIDVVDEQKPELLKLLSDNKIEYIPNKAGKIKIKSIPKEVKVKPEVMKKLNDTVVTLKSTSLGSVVEDVNKIMQDTEFMDFYNKNNPNMVLNDLGRIAKDVGGVDLNITEDYVRRALEIGRSKTKGKGFTARKTADTSDIISENIRYSQSKQRNIANLDKEIDLNAGQLSEVMEADLINKLDNLSEKLANKEARFTKQLGKVDEKTQKLFNTLIEKESKRFYISEVYTDKLFNKFQKLTPGKELDDLISLTSKAKGEEKKLKELLDSIDTVDDSKIANLVVDTAKQQDKVIELSNKVEDAIQKMDAKVINTAEDVITKGYKYADSVAKNSNEVMRVKDKLKSVQDTKKLIRSTMDDSVARTTDQLNYLQDKLNSIVNDPQRAAKDLAIRDKIRNLEKQKALLTSKDTEKLFTQSITESFADFIETAGVEMKSKRVMNEILLSDTFNNPDLFRLVSKGTNEVPQGMVSVSEETLKKVYNTWDKLVEDPALIDAFKTKVKGQDIYMNPMIHTMLFRRVSPSETKQLLNMFNSANNTFKKLKTLSPGFHVRNSVGNPVNMWLSGMNAGQIPIYQAKAGKTWGKVNNLIDKLSIGAKLTDEEAKTYQLLTEFADAGLFKTSGRVLDLDEVIKASKNGGNLPKQAYDWIFKMNAEMNAKVDGVNRLALFLYAKDNPKYVSKLGLEDAGEAVRKVLFDPNDLSPVEQDFMKKIIPFYTFTKQNLFLQMDNITRNPARYNRIIKANNALWDGMFDEEEYMDWQKEGFNFPLPINDADGNPMMLKLNLPLSDVGEYLQNPGKRALSSLTPAIRAPFEAVTGKEIFTGRDIDLSGMGGLDFLAKNTGLDLFTKQVGKATQLGNIDSVGSGITTLLPSVASKIDPDNNVEINQYNELDELQTYIKKLKDAGVAVRDIDEIKQTVKQRLAKIKRDRKKNLTF